MPLDLTMRGLEAPVAFEPTPDLEAAKAMTPALPGSGESFNPVAVSPSLTGPETGSALGSPMDQAAADVI